MLKNFVHDCDACEFLGCFDGHDLYHCGDTVIARFGDEGPDYKSMPTAEWMPDTSDVHLAQARDWAKNGTVEVLPQR